VKLLAKRMRKVNIDKLIKEGRGIGVGKEYKPWIRIQDVPSLGRSSRIRGIKTGRQHEFLSDMEKNYFYFLEYSDIVQDIREQFPLLPLEDTLLIAEELGINHPKNSETDEFTVMTVDFLVTMKVNNKIIEVVRTIKPKDELLNKRVIEKFEIERTYWQKRGIDYGIITEDEIDKNISDNLSYLYGYKEITNLDSFIDISADDLKDLIYEFIKRILDSRRTVRTICSQFDNDMSLDKGSGLSIFKYLVWNKIISIDITQKIDVNTIIPIIKVKEDIVTNLEVI
jgi:hypothetical protein